MKGMPHFRQYPMGDVVNANLEPGEYVVRRNAVNALGVDNMELLNHADSAHGALNKLMVSASLVNHQSQDNTSVKTEANGFPIADSPVRQRVDATRQMQEGGPVDAPSFRDELLMEASSVPRGGMGGAELYDALSRSGKGALKEQMIERAMIPERETPTMKDELLIRALGEARGGGANAELYDALSGGGRGALKSRLLERAGVSGYQTGGEAKVIRGSRPIESKIEVLMSEKGDPYYKSRNIMSVPASQVDSEGGPRFYLGEDTSRDMQMASDKAQMDARWKMAHSPSDSIPSAMVEGYFDEPSKISGFLKRLGINKQEGGVVRGYQEGGPVPYEPSKEDLMLMLNEQITNRDKGMDVVGMDGKPTKFHQAYKTGSGQFGKMTDEEGNLWWKDEADREFSVVPQINIDRKQGEKDYIARGREDVDIARIIQEYPSAYRKDEETGDLKFSKGRIGRKIQSYVERGGTNVPYSGRAFIGDAEFNQGGPVYGYKNGGQVKGDVPSGNWGPKGAYNEALAASQDSTISEQELKVMALMDHFRKMGTGERLESSDKYNGKPTYKSEEAYRRAFGMQTPLDAKERFTQARLGLSPETFSAQQRGLLGKVLLQRLGNEVQ